jgi:hypothetical protein
LNPLFFYISSLSAIIPLRSLEFDALRRFLESQMRMSHIYQPLMLLTIASRHPPKASHPFPYP